MCVHTYFTVSWSLSDFVHWREFTVFLWELLIQSHGLVPLARAKYSIMHAVCAVNSRKDQSSNDSI